MPRSHSSVRHALRGVTCALLVLGLLGVARPASAVAVAPRPAADAFGDHQRLPLIPVRKRPANLPVQAAPLQQPTATQSSAPHATAGDGSTVSQVPDPPDGPAKSTWHVTYHGFGSNAQAQAAFKAAVDIWARIVSSPVTIEVDATFTQLEPGLLGQANACGAYLRSSDSSYYPAPLAEAISGTDLDAGEPGGCDIVAEFTTDPNPSDPSVGYYFGTDGLPPAGQYDFESVVLHELGHGLGISGTMDIDAITGRGTYGFDATHPNPLIFDRFTCDAATGGNRLLSFPNDSTTLATKLQNGSVYWGGALNSCAAAGTRPKLYAPASWEPGSSYAHLDDVTYPQADANSLMTPYADYQESVHSPGPLAVDMLSAMGWSAAIPVPTPPGAASAVTAGLGNARSTVRWTAPSNAGVGTTYTVTSSPGGRTCTATGGLTSCTVTGLTNGTPYTFTVVGSNSGGTGPASAASAPVTPDGTAPTVTGGLKAGAPLVYPVVTFGGTDAGSGIGGYRIDYQMAPWNGGFGTSKSIPISTTATSGSKQITMDKGSTLCWTVTSLDRAGNASPSTLRKCTTLALDDRSLAASAGWARATSSVYYASTATTIRGTNATLTRTGVQTRRIWLVATQCSTCGTVGVYWNGTLIKKVSLYRSTTAQRAVFYLYDLGAVRSGTIVIKTLSSGPVNIDGLGLGRY